MSHILKYTEIAQLLVVSLLNQDEKKHTMPNRLSSTHLFTKLELYYQ